MGAKVTKLAHVRKGAARRWRGGSVPEVEIVWFFKKQVSAISTAIYWIFRVTHAISSAGNVCSLCESAISSRGNARYVLNFAGISWLLKTVIFHKSYNFSTFFSPDVRKWGTGQWKRRSSKTTKSWVVKKWTLGEPVPPEIVNFLRRKCKSVKNQDFSQKCVFIACLIFWWFFGPWRP